jgi:hypothetical protein
MADWAFIVTPLLVLPIILLFRFIGCGLDAVGTNKSPPRYRDYIMAEPNNPGVVTHKFVKPDRNAIIAYWRLLDGGGLAEDQKKFVPGIGSNFFDGQYKTTASLPAVAPSGSTAGSESAPGNFDMPKASLVVSDPGVSCRLFNGGYVEVPYKAGLFTEQFTIEAWVQRSWGPNIDGYEHVLFEAGGFYVPPFDPSQIPSYRGFSVLVDGGNRWQVRLLPHGDVFTNGPLIVANQKVHVAVTVANIDPVGVKKRVRLYVQGVQAGADVIVPNYALPLGAPLYIGVANHAKPGNPPEIRHPMISMIQEVVLHRTELTHLEIFTHFEINRL